MEFHEFGDFFENLLNSTYFKIVFKIVFRLLKYLITGLRMMNYLPKKATSHFPRDSPNETPT